MVLDSSTILPSPDAHAIVAELLRDLPDATLISRKSQ